MSVQIDVELNNQWRDDLAELRGEFEALDGTEADLLANIRPAMKRLKTLKKELHSIDKRDWQAEVDVKVNRKKLQEQIQKAAAKAEVPEISVSDIDLDDDVTISVDADEQSIRTLKELIAETDEDGYVERNVTVNRHTNYTSSLDDGTEDDIEWISEDNETRTIWFDEKLRRELWVQDKEATVWYDERRSRSVWTPDRKSTHTVDEEWGDTVFTGGGRSTVRYDAEWNRNAKEKFATKLASYTSALNNSNVTTLKYDLELRNTDQFRQQISRIGEAMEEAGVPAPGGGGDGRMGHGDPERHDGPKVFDGLGSSGDRSFAVSRMRDQMKARLGGFGRSSTDISRGINSRPNIPRPPGSRDDRGGGFFSGISNLMRGGVSSIIGSKESESRTAEQIREMNEAAKGAALKALPTSMSKWYSVLSMLLPVIIAMGVQLAGVATAMLAVAGAGAAMMGLGLLGFGSSFGDSMAKAQQHLQEFKSEMFGAIQPAAQAFAPFTQEMLGTFSLRFEQAGIAEALTGFLQFEDTINAALDGALNWVADVINAMTRFEPILSQLALRFGDIIGSGIIDFFSWLAMEAYNNQDMLVTLSEAFVNILYTLYQVIMVVANLVTFLEPLTVLFAGLANMLNTPVVRGLIAVIALMWALNRAVLAAVAAHALLIEFNFMAWAKNAASGITLLIGKLVALHSSLAAAIGAKAALLGMTIGGAALVIGGLALGKMAYESMKPKGDNGYSDFGAGGGGMATGTGGAGMGGPGPQMGGMGTTGGGVQIIVQGDMTEEGAQRIEDKIAQGARSEITLDKTQNPDE